MNNKMKKLALAAIIAFGSFQFLSAKENEGMQHRNAAPTGGNQIAASCAPSTSRKDLDINNIRTPIFINGDMWWDLNGNAQYEVPKDSKKYSLFAGALWLGGYDQGGNLKIAAQTYRQSGSDFWPGPVDVSNATTIGSVCTKFDRHWRVTREEVKAFVDSRIPGHIAITPSLDIQQWSNYYLPNSNNYSNQLAPYHDENGDGAYDWEQGDYPGYNLNEDQTIHDNKIFGHEYLLGDQTLWWVFNDVGNVHGETGGQHIGFEIQSQAFAFATNDDINNMTFYKYKIINRSSLSVGKTYFGAWVDPDLGNYLDDFVGCDVKRGFGYCYNGDAYDDGITGYGFNPPAIGYDFFQGPAADIGDGLDNDRDSCIDCTWSVDPFGNRVQIPEDSAHRELIIMSKFVYYNNDFSFFGNPSTDIQYYNYMKGIWKNGNKMYYGGNGHGSGNFATTDTCDFMFPGDSDPHHWGTNGAPEIPWDEGTAGNTPSDRRFLQSAGPFTLQPGAVNYITTGAVWGRAGSGGAMASVQLIRIADDKAQKLFDHNFAITNGPDAPDLSIRELDQELIFSILNPPQSNNYNESYSEIDPNLSLGSPDPRYHFEGYQVFQLKDATVAISDIHSPEKARLVFQSDIKNGIAQVVNYFRDPITAAYYGVEEVNGADNGTRHVFRIKKDKFATGNDDLINHKIYYYTVLAYGYNSVESDEFNYNNTTDGDGKAYISGRRRIATYTAIPHKITMEANGLVLNTFFGDGPEITRIEGKGNGHLIGSDRKALDLTQASVDQIILNNTSGRVLHPVYQKGRGPVDIRVYDPVKVIGGNFELREVIKTSNVKDPADHDVVIGTFIDTNVTPYDTLKIVADTLWELKNLGTGQVMTSVKSLRTPYDQLVQFPDPNNPTSLTDYGFYINMTQVVDLKNPRQTLYPGDEDLDGTPFSGFIEATLSFADAGHRWLTGVRDRDNVTKLDWIASGKSGYTYDSGPNIPTSQTEDGTQTWEKLIGGTWAPYKFTQRDSTRNGPAYQGNNDQQVTLAGKFADQTSVDVVFTADRRYWSKCMVIEEQPKTTKSIGGAAKCKLRRSTSLKFDGSLNLVADTGTGYSYFPGYAINPETGERLNVAFGEDSYFTAQNGADMKWNPTSTLVDAAGNYVLGGKHVVYVFAHNNQIPLYDGCATLGSLLNVGSLPNLKIVWGACMWVGYPMLVSGENLLDNKATVRIRVARPYEKYQTDNPSANNDLPFYTFSTGDLVSKTGDVETAKTALDLINVVPNPYYAYSTYEKNQLDNRIKITNLPSKCTITIYTPSGTLIRQMRRDVNSDNTSGSKYPETNLETALEWDLKNTAGVPVASGIYIIHIEAPGIGEKTIKWFGVLRPIDLDTF